MHTRFAYTASIEAIRTPAKHDEILVRQMNGNSGFFQALRLFLLALPILAGVAWWFVKVTRWDRLEACMTSAIAPIWILFLACPDSDAACPGFAIAQPNAAGQHQISIVMPMPTAHSSESHLLPDARLRAINSVPALSMTRGCISSTSYSAT